jgi:hypothetical protein
VTTQHALLMAIAMMDRHVARLMTPSLSAAHMAAASHMLAADAGKVSFATLTQHAQQTICAVMVRHAAKSTSGSYEVSD